VTADPDRYTNDRCRDIVRVTVATAEYMCSNVRRPVFRHGPLQADIDIETIRERGST